MASFDASRGCTVVRVVYDGPGYAGKTTNLRRICDLVPIQRRSEMVTPASLKGRTMFFDWLEIDGPRQDGSSLKFQLITVPGQIERNYRRRPLVEVADVVVFVCDSSPEQVPDTLRTFARLRASMKRRRTPVPLVVQANKQDVEGALSPALLRKKLGLAEDVPLVLAQAVSGQGVQETLRAALRLGVRTLGGEALQPLAAAFANADALFDHVLSFEDNPKNDDQPVEVEEVDVRAKHADLDPASMLAHLAASSFESLEARARRAAERVRDDADRGSS